MLQWLKKSKNHSWTTETQSIDRHPQIFNLLEQIPSNNIPWTVILLSIGIGIYFSLPFEGDLTITALLLLVVLVIWLVPNKSSLQLKIISLLLIVLLGYAAALFRTHSVKTPLLSSSSKSYHYTMAVDTIEPLQKSRIRYSGTLLALSKTKQQQRPIRLRIRTTDQGPRFKFGDVVCGRTILKRPNGPLIPGGYDFGKALWFKQIGGTGFTISQMKICRNTNTVAKNNNPLFTFIATLRNAIATRIDAHLSEPKRSMARALILGDRGRIKEQDLIALRNAGLGHLLAISGLHMAVFAGTIFFLARAALALFPIYAQKYPIKKWAAIIALFGGTVYFLISGQSIPTQRAFLMINILFAAIILERPALTLRNVALAALVILIFRPDSLLSAGFQMSFAAVTALVVAYQFNLKYQPLTFFAKHNWARPFYYLSGIWMTSLIATLATAPFAIYHFNQFSYMGPVGNMLAIPIFTLLLMPAAVLSLALMPFGIEQLAMIPLGISIEMLLSTAHWTSSFDPAILSIGKITLSSVIIFTFAALILFFTRRPFIYLAIPLIIIALATARPGEKPALYVGSTGDIIALRGNDGQLYAPDGRKSKFVLQNWLKADGDPKDQSEIRNSDKLICDESACSGQTANKTVTLLKNIDALAEECERADILIYKHSITRPCPNPELILTKTELSKLGPHTIYIKDGKTRVERANDFRNNRIWSGTIK